MKTIKCFGCGEIYEFKETGCVDSMPDGELFNSNWYCARCVEEMDEED